MADQIVTYRDESLEAPFVRAARVGYRPDKFRYKYLRDSAGATDMAVDGTVPVIYKYTVPANKVFHWKRCIIHLKDSGSKPNDFGGITGPLSNGLLMAVHDSFDDELLDFTDGVPVATNADFGNMASVDVNIKGAQGGADDSILVRWTLENDGAAMILYEHEYFAVTIRDNIAALTSMRIGLRGLFFDAIYE